MTSEPRFFATPAAFRAWLAEHHASAKELHVGYHKVGSGKPSMTWPESVDEALCFGWIDGVRRSLGPDAYMIRFTPRKPGSTWSRVNVERMKALTAEGRMTEAGLAAFARRKEERTAVYAYEREADAKLAPEMERRLKADEKAWADFQARPASYRRDTLAWVTGAKKEETRERRFETLLACSREGRPIPTKSYGKKP